MRFLLHCAVILATLCSVLACELASGQSPPSPDRPKFFVWAEGLPCGIVPTSGDFLVAMPKLFLGEGWTGTQAANAVADYVFDHTRTHTWRPLNNTPDTGCHGLNTEHAPDLYSAANHPNSNNICVSIHNFGVETYAQQAAQPLFSSQLRFFTETDRLVDYINLTQNSDGTLSNKDIHFGFPVNPQVPHPLPDPPPPLQAWYANRTYRHPFLWNAGFRESTRGTPPLKAWMQAFVAEYKERHENDPSIPIPQRWYFDTEPNLTWYGSINEQDGSINAGSADCVRILEQIYESRNSTNTTLYPNFWDGEGVPGDPGDPNQGCGPGECTLRQAYLRDRIKFNLPVYPAGHPNAGEPDFSEFTSNTGTLQNPSPRPGSHLRNRAIMLWWNEVCQHAADQVMKNCLYDVIAAEWPSAKVGNYNTTKQSGTLHNAGAVLDSTCQYEPPSGNDPGDDSCWLADRASRASYGGGPAGSTALLEQSPACSRFVDVDGAGFHHIYPLMSSGVWQSERRWGSVVQRAFGSVDSPVIYPLSVDPSWQNARQRNPYARMEDDGNLWETREQAGRRFMRLELESAAGGRLDIEGEREVVPWILMGGTALRDDPYLGYSVYEQAQDMAMLRSKKVKEAIVWTNLRLSNANFAPSWTQMEQTIADVYAPRLVAITYSGPNNTIVNTTSPSDLDKLNDTLEVGSGTPKAIELFAHPSESPSTPGSLALKFHNYRDPQNPDVDLSELVNDGYDFLIIIECRAYIGHGTGTTPETEANIKVSCKLVDGTYATLSSSDGEGSVSTGRNALGITRCVWYVPNSAREQSSSRMDPSYLYIEAKRNDPSPFRVVVDLVQVVPYKINGAQIVDSACDPSFSFSTNTATNPVVIGSTTFAEAGPDGGAKFVWNNPIYPEYLDDQVTEKYIRVYRCTGDEANPLADVTCATEQTLDSTGQIVYMRYRATGSTGPTPMPIGFYKFCTYTCATDLNNGCRGWIYPRLRTDVITATEGNPLVKKEWIWVEVAGVCPPPPNFCPADVDDGSSTGTPDQGVTIDDLLYYLFAFENGIIQADVDDGSFTGSPDGGVTIDDLLYYLYRFEQGC